jgi:hypothetical protein
MASSFKDLQKVFNQSSSNDSSQPNLEVISNNPEQTSPVSPKEKSSFESLQNIFNNKQASTSVEPTVTTAESKATESKPEEEPWYSNFRGWLYENILTPISEGQELEAKARKVMPKILAKTAVDIAKTPAVIGEAALIVSGQGDTAEAIRKSDVGKLYTSIFNKINPEVTKEEEIASEFVSYLTAAGIGRKLAREGAEVIISKYPSKGRKIAQEINRQLGGKSLGVTDVIEKAAVKSSSALGSAAGFTAVDIATREDNEQFIQTIKKIFPEEVTWIENNLDFANLIKDLEIKPEDEYDDIKLKQYQDSLLLTSVGGAVAVTAITGIKAALKLAAKTGSNFKNIISSIKNRQKPSSEITPNKFSASEEKLVTEESAKRLDDWAVKKAKDDPNFKLDMEAKEGAIPLATSRSTAKKFEEIKQQVIKELEDSGTIRKLEPSPKQILNTAIKDGATKIPKPSGDKVVTSSKVTQNPDGVVTMYKTIVEKIGNLNTSLGRELTSSRSMPKEFDTISFSRMNADREFNLDIKYRLKELLKNQKKNKVSKDDFKAYLNENKNNNLPEEFTKSVDELTSIINANENKIFRTLGVKDGTIGIRTDGQKFYYTRQYEAIMNPSWYKDVVKGLKVIRGANKESDENEFLAMLWRGKQFFRDRGFPENEIEGQIKNLLAGAKKENSNLLNDFFEGASTKSLRGRQEIPIAIRELMGEITDPIKKLESTLISQNKIISELKWLGDIEKYALTNLGKDIKLGGVLPFLPTRRVRFERGSKDTIKGEPINLEQLVKDTIGKLGGSVEKGSKKYTASTSTQARLMENLWTSRVFSGYMERGLDLYSPNKKGGNAFQQAMAATASIFQSAETILDPFAYALNTTGAVNSLLANGHLFNPKNYGRAVKEMETMLQQIIKNDPKALAKLGMLKRLGVIDQDVTGEMIANNVKMYGTNPAKWPIRTGSKALTAAGRLYGQPDMWAKLIAFESEAATLRNIFPHRKLKDLNSKEYTTFVNEKAAEIVRDTMPTYGASLPLMRRMARYPVIGNYILFPTEVIRNHKNIIFKHAIPDIIEGAKNRNWYQVSRGFRRLSGTGATIYGVDFLFDNNNDKKGIDSNHKKGMQILQPDFGKGSKEWFSQGFIIDDRITDKITRKSIKKQFPKEDWENIRKQFNMKEADYTKFINERYNFRKKNVKPFLSARTVSSMSLDATDYLKSVFKLGMAASVGNKNMSSEEIDNAGKNALLAATGPYLSPKRLVAAMANAYFGIEKRTGKQIYDTAVGADWKNNFIKFAGTIAKGFGGGAQKAVREHIMMTDAEELYGEGMAMRASGFPITPQFLSKFALLGAYERGRNIEKEIGYNLSKDIKNIDALKKTWVNDLRNLGRTPGLKTETDVNNVVNLYTNLTDRKFKGMQNLAEKVHIFNNFKYTHIKRNGEKEVKTIRKSGLLYKILSQDFLKNVHPTVSLTLFANIGKEAEGGVFFPDSLAQSPINNKSLVMYLQEVGFNEDQSGRIYDSIMEKESKYKGKELKKRESK